MHTKRNSWYLLLLCISFLSFTACSDDDDDNVNDDDDLTGSFMAMDQMVMDGTIVIGEINMSHDGWVVIHRDNGNGGPMVPGIISVPVQVSEGMSSDVMISFEDGVEIEDGEMLWVMLHTDTGNIGEYEFDGSNGLDNPIMDENGNMVTSSITVQTGLVPTGMFTVNDQAVMNNMLMVSSITMNQDGWVVVHADNGDMPQLPGIISEPFYLEAGTTENVEIMFEESASVNSGDQVWVMLHTDTGITGEYEFDGTNGLDGPILDVNGNILMTEISIL
ncbi:MAG TPA: hypothetical protein VFM70_11690 [Salinimicrobium sp.]|nr:hypothetical protein [Salinimicrobium sp.]